MVARRCELLLSLSGLLACGAAHAESPYCEKVKARANGDAALLMAPRAVVQGIRFPASGQLDVGALAGNGYQLRAGLAFSPLDFYKGLRVKELGDASCAEHGASEGLKDSLARAEVRARFAATKEQESYLSSRQAEWRTLLKTAAGRLESRVITLVQFEDLRGRADALERKLVVVQGASRELATDGATTPAAGLRELTQGYVASTAKVEHEAARVRSLDAWKFQMAGGVIPQAPVDWYGLVELQFSFGAFEHNRQNGLAVEARDAEVRHAPYELSQHARTLVTRMRASKESAERESELLDSEIAFLTRTRHTLDASDAENVAHARDALAIEQIAIESDRVFSRAFAKALSSFLEERK